MDSPFVGYLAAVLMGAVLGLLGGGGSILTLPILVYMFQVEPVLASSYSLFVVGLAALVGTLRYHRSGMVRFGLAVTFGIPSVLGVVTARRFVLPNIPDSIGYVGSIEVTRDLFILLLFALLMVAAGFAMLRSRPPGETNSDDELHVPGWRATLLVVAEGMVVGLITGLVGAGGGFLIVPALVLLIGIPIRVAIGTSLAIIAAKSLIGFAVDTELWPQVDAKFLAQFTAAAVVGMMVGVLANQRVPTAGLKTGFGWFVVVLGLLILAKELLFTS